MFLGIVLALVTDMRKLGFAFLSLCVVSCLPGAGSPGVEGGDAQPPEVRVPIVVEGGNNTVDGCQGVTEVGICSPNKKSAARCNTRTGQLEEDRCDADETCDVGNGMAAACRKTNQEDAEIGNPEQSNGSCTAKAQQGYCKTENGVSTAYYHWNDFGSDETGVTTPTCKAVHMECGRAEFDQFCCEVGEDCSESSNVAHAWCYDAQGQAVGGTTVPTNSTPASGNQGSTNGTSPEPEEEISDKERVRREQEALCQDPSVDPFLDFFLDLAMCSSNYKFFDCQEKANGDRELVEVHCGDTNGDGQIREFHDEELMYCDVNNRAGKRDCVSIPESLLENN